MAIPPSGLVLLEESWTADQIRNHPEGLIGSAVRDAAGAGTGEPGPLIDISSLPTLGNNRRRWQTSVYQVSNVMETRNGLTEYAVVVRSDLHQVICRRTLTSTSGWTAWSEVIDLRTITGDPFGDQVDDSHNTFSMAEDENGNIHVWGNMHSDAMRYARTATPGDITTLTKYTPWSANANLVTYPVPYIDPSGTLCIGWRNGYATSGDYFISRFVGGVWSAPLRILNGSATNQGAYPNNPAVRDGKIGLFFMWRGEGDASTNERPGYIESLDNGTTWQTVTGTPVSLPVTRNTAPVILDVSVGSGLINQGNGDFDTDGHPHTAWQMYDSEGNSQLFHFWHDGSSWHVDQATRWTHRIETVGQTTLALDVARAQTLCTENGRTYLVSRSAHDGIDGAPVLIDVTPGGDPKPFKLMAMNLDGWEPAYDVPRFRRTGHLAMLVTPVAQNSNSETNWDAQWLGVLDVDMNRVQEIQAGSAKLPVIRTIRSYDRSLQANNVGGTTEADIDRSVLPWSYISARDVGKKTQLFSRVTALVFFESGSSSATLYLRETPRAGGLPTSDVSFIRMVNSSLTGMFSTPWEPLRNSPYVETNGTRRDTMLVPRAVVNNAAGLQIRSYIVEVGVLDWT